MGSSLCYRLPVSHLLTHLLIGNSLISPTHIVGCYLPPAHTPTHTHTPTLAIYSRYLLPVLRHFRDREGIETCFCRGGLSTPSHHWWGGFVATCFRRYVHNTPSGITHHPLCKYTPSDHALLIDICLICPPYRDVGETPRTR